LDINAQYVKATRSYYVMNDMSRLEAYQDRPYIKGWPYMKYYAEVPIHSPSGLTIGTLCVVDNKARDGLDLKGLAILREISEVVMNHLELCVSKIHRNNAEKMIQALGQFVEGKDSMREWWIEAQASRLAEPGLQHLSVEKRADIELGSRNEINQPPALDALLAQSASVDYFGSALSSNARSITPEHPVLSDGRSETPKSPGTVPTSLDPIPSVAQTPGSETQKASESNQFALQEFTELQKMLNRATNLIREGIGLDGIVLFDPRSSDGQLLTDFNIAGEKVSWAERRSSIISSTAQSPPFIQSPPYFPPYDQQTPPPIKYCRVLASSTRSKSDNDCRAGEGLLVPENVLQQVLHRYPRGGILNYDKKGFIGGDDSIFLHPSGSQKFRGRDVIKPPTADGPNSMEADQLRSILPNATSVLLLPLWDLTQDKWFAYSLAWTTNPARIFRRQDFTYLASFGNSIMTELSRLETVAADNAKSQFISSISHELRSPLHGIMASVELLRDVNTDPVSNAIISTIDSCGSTLLDTIENLLTFTKINRLTARASSLVPRCLPSIDLAALVEDVTQMLIAGHYFRRTVDTSGALHYRQTDFATPQIKVSPGLTVICDISPACDWVFKTDAGVWKRTLMNLLGNALKYTSSGFILVKLRLEEDLPSVDNKARPSMLARRSKSMIDEDLRILMSSVAARAPLEHLSTSSKKTLKSCNISLTIEDSGKGMSQDYLTHHLFKPFYQEDTLSPGTGLGLSIVHQLVTSIGGFVHVTSELGSGTEVRVNVALERPDVTTPTNFSKPPQFQGLRLGLCGLDAVPDLSETPSGILDSISRRGLALRSTLAEYATSIGLSVTSIDSLDSKDVDLTLATEAEYHRITSSRKSFIHKPLIVLATEPVLRYGQMTTEFGSAIVLSQP
jgi:signal transduction histidine kinase